MPAIIISSLSLQKELKLYPQTMNRICFLLCALFLSPSMMSQSIVHNLDITVTLKHNGDAHIREVWKIDMGEDVMTEWYVAHYISCGTE